MIYFDNSATTYPKPEEVYKSLDYANRNLAFNAGRGTYKNAVDVSNIIDEARDKIASFVTKSKNDVVFTSSATESLNLIINGIDFCDGDIVFVSPFEHNAIIRPLYNVKKRINIDIQVLPFNKKTWEPELNKIRDIFQWKHPKAVFISQVSNVTGLEIQYQEIFKLAKEYDAICVLDSAQSFGVKNPKLEYTDFCVFAGHKSLYASFGIAGFVINTNYKLLLSKLGGNGSDSLNHDMPESGFARYESGSPNSVAIYGLLNSCNWLVNNDVESIEKNLSNYLISELEKNDKIILYLPESKKTLGIVSFNVKGYESDEVSAILGDEFNICVRSGFHCSPLVHDFIGSLEYKGTVRVSFGAFNTKEEVNVLIEALKTL